MSFQRDVGLNDAVAKAYDSLHRLAIKDVLQTASFETQCGSINASSTEYAFLRSTASLQLDEHVNRATSATFLDVESAFAVVPKCMIVGNENSRAEFADDLRILGLGESEVEFAMREMSIDSYWSDNGASCHLNDILKDSLNHIWSNFELLGVWSMHLSTLDFPGS